MKHTRFILAGVILFAFISCRKEFKNNHFNSGSSQHSVKQMTDKKNIILIVMDDIGYEVPTFTGGQSYSTPNLDSLSCIGLRFDSCHAAPLCSPSRVMMVTGKYNQQNYLYWGHLDSTQKTIGNMLQDAGYATAAIGKWQFDGGDTAFRHFGFSRYWVFDWYTIQGESDDASNNTKYKNPVIYANGSQVPTSYTAGKYGPDLFEQYEETFIDSCVTNNPAQPFFTYYATPLCHAPFSPTPDDTLSYAKWNSTKSDAKYFPSMVKYMDKIIGRLCHHLDSLGITDNTVIMIAGDNGTPPPVTSIQNGISI